MTISTNVENRVPSPEKLSSPTHIRVPGLEVSTTISPCSVIIQENFRLIPPNVRSLCQHCCVPRDIEGATDRAPELLGLAAVALAAVWIAVVSLPLRVACLLGASLCFPASFHYQKDWPPWVRWLLSVLTVSFLICVALIAIRDR